MEVLLQNLIVAIVSSLELSLALLANSSQCHLGCEKYHIFPHSIVTS